MSIPFKSDPSSLRQHQLFPSNIFDLLPEDHDCFLFKDLLNQLDTSRIEALYSPNGQHAYHLRHKHQNGHFVVTKSLLMNNTGFVHTKN